MITQASNHLDELQKSLVLARSWCLHASRLCWRLFWTFLQWRKSGCQFGPPSEAGTNWRNYGPPMHVHFRPVCHHVFNVKSNKETTTHSFNASFYNKICFLASWSLCIIYMKGKLTVESNTEAFFTCITCHLKYEHWAQFWERFSRFNVLEESDLSSQLLDVLYDSNIVNRKHSSLYKTPWDWVRLSSHMGAAVSKRSKLWHPEHYRLVWGFIGARWGAGLFHTSRVVVLYLIVFQEQNVSSHPFCLPTVYSCFYILLLFCEANWLIDIYWPEFHLKS